MSLCQPKQTQMFDDLEDIHFFILTRIGVNVQRIFEIALIIAFCRIYRSSFFRVSLIERIKAISHAYNFNTRIPLRISFIIFIRRSLTTICFAYFNKNSNNLSDIFIHTVSVFWILCRYKLMGIMISNKTTPGTMANCICR